MDTITETFRHAAHVVADYADDVATGCDTGNDTDDIELLVIGMHRLLLDLRDHAAVVSMQRKA